MVYVQFGSMAFVQRHFRSYKVTCVLFSSYFLEKGGSDVDGLTVASLSERIDSKASMHIDLLRSVSPLDL